jgi:FtsP/CotA-like multicopper oxidase with cupredoxin domain
MQWLINGRQFEMGTVADDEQVKLNTTEVWEVINAQNPGQMMDENGMPHPFHIHGVQFNVIGRAVTPDLKPLSDTVREGYMDQGWKDTVLLMPGERVKLLMRFTSPGTFVFHCHNLEHEDMGMMRNYSVMV